MYEVYCAMPYTLSPKRGPSLRMRWHRGAPLLSLLETIEVEARELGLNAIGLKPTGIIAILQALKTSGALQAELVVQ